MASVAETQPTQSREAEMDEQLDELLARIVARTATDRDLVKYQELLASRTRLMRPSGINWRGGVLRRFA